MSTQTRHKCDEYYKIYLEHDISFTKEIISEIKLIPEKNYLRYGGMNIPCILYSSSMIRARIIAQLQPSICEKISLGNKTTSLCLAFRREKGEDPVTLFINAKIAGLTPYKSDIPGVNFITLKYMNKPPDDFIYKLGEAIFNKTEENKRKEQRINLDDEKTKRLKLQTDKIWIFCDGKQSPCVLKDISFSGAKIITRGKKDSFLKKNIKLILNISNLEGISEMTGTVTHCEEIIVNKNIKFIALGLAFDKASIPDSYKEWVNSFIQKEK
ncbi:MAG: PilZ domain-containing protein [Spirochaetales bacterium]|nr:PilZ domain-containing protein [Spirochaetales bacterium]